MISSDALTVKAPAKLNLFLEIGERMEDGYHKIESIMQSVTLYDELTVKKAEDGIAFDCSNKKLIYGGNLVIRAAKLFFEQSGLKGGASVYLDKKIPVSAGLGGGSSDAAATLNALNELYGSPFSQKILSLMGKQLGADVPFCIKRGLCRAFGIGDLLEPLPPLPSCFFTIAKGNATVCTRDAYERIDGCGKREIRSCEKMTEMIKKGDLSGICRQLYNGFEIHGDHDDAIKRIMKEHNAENALMSGSGPSVFGVFRRLKDAEDAGAELEARGYECFVCAPETSCE